MNKSDNLSDSKCLAMVYTRWYESRCLCRKMAGLEMGGKCSTIGTGNLEVQPTSRKEQGSWREFVLRRDKLWMK